MKNISSQNENGGGTVRFLVDTVGLSLEIQVWSKKRFQGKFAEIVYQNHIKPND